MLKQEDKRYLMLSALYLFLSGLLVFGILKYGIKASLAIYDLLHKGNTTTETSLYDQAPPAPQLFAITEATNSANLVISGYTLPKLQVHIFLNDLDILTVESDSEGKFEENLSLALSNNSIYAKAFDLKNRESQPSKTWNIFYSNTPPFIEITEPAKDSTIRKNPNIEIKGKFDPSSKILINDHSVITQKNPNEEFASFSYPFKLNEGDNLIKIKCIDPAQNQTEIDWIVKFQK